jgi:aminodeoxyfutalosine synthase
VIPAVFRASGIRDLLEKAVAGERLSAGDGVRLFESDDLPALGWAANLVRERRHGDVAYYLKNRHINYSNICKYDCMFCSFYRSSGEEEGAWEWSVKDVLEHVAPYKDSGLREFHIVGGVHPDLPFSYYTDMLAALKREHPGVALKAFTAIEIAYFAELTSMSLREVLEALQEAGLDMIPGGGAEVFADRVRYKVCREKADADRWFEVHETAHALGIPTNATLLYGHIETVGERVDHLLRLRDLQDRTRGLGSYVPLAELRPARLPPGQQPAGEAGRADRRGRAAKHRRGPSAARQRRPHQGLLDHARHQGGPAGAGLGGR